MAACLVHDLPRVRGQRAIRARLEIGILDHFVRRVLEADALERDMRAQRLRPRSPFSSLPCPAPRNHRKGIGDEATELRVEVDR